MTHTQVRPERMPNNDRLLLAYISAASHSGSTLLAMLLNSHAQICTAGELKLANIKDVDNYRCSCKSMISDCDFWKSVATGLERRGSKFDMRDAGTDLATIPSTYVRRLTKPLFRDAAAEHIRDILLSLSPSWRKYFPDWQRRNEKLVEEIARVSGCRVIVDSSKTGLRLKYLRTVSGLKSKMIRLIRDGRAVALTYMDAANFADAANPALRGGGTGTRIHHDLPMAKAAMEWRRSNEEAEYMAAAIGEENVVRVRYEELCTETRDTLNRIAVFLGLEPSFDFDSFRDVPHHVVGNGMRLDDTSEIRLDDRWRNKLTKNDLETFDRVGGALNAEYGYE